jgi:ribose/xylose/arabinose/galactoside ABC-type transport system permease subunit
VPLSSISNMVDLLGVSAWYQQLLKGAIMLLGAAVDVGRRELVRKPSAAARWSCDEG